MTLLFFPLGERCANIMDNSLILTDDLIETPTNIADKENVRPGNQPFTVDGNEAEVIVNLKPNTYASGDVTKIDIDTKNVDTVKVYVQYVGGVWKPLNLDTPGSTEPQEFLPNDLPIVLEPRLEDVTKLRIEFTRTNPNEEMEIDVDIWACLESGTHYTFSICNLAYFLLSD